jgi:thiol-disulfide isomerase/thioredoxin
MTVNLYKIPCYFWFIGFMCIGKTFGQQVTGRFELLENQDLVLEAFTGLSTYLVDSTTTDASGNFKLSYSANNHGMGLLRTKNGKGFLLVLEPEGVELKGLNTQEYNEIVFIKGIQNQSFVSYSSQYGKRDNALSAWRYLQQIYTKDSLFLNKTLVRDHITNEIKRIEQEDAGFIQQLAEDSYVRWYLPTKKLLSSVAAVAQFRPEEIPATLEALRSIDYAGDRLHNSGLLKEAIENHVWFIENSSGTLDQVYLDLNKSIDIMLGQLLTNENRYNDITEYLFNLLEKRSLFTSAEYLALSVLNEQTCSINNNLAKQLESYRQMKKGNTAANINFGEYTYVPAHINAASLKDIKARYKVVVFGAGWCSYCKEDMPKLAAYYNIWKQDNVEVVLVSLDENINEFANFTGSLPFVSTTTLEKWDTKAVKDYHVYATPTYFLLDDNLTIILKPKNIEHLNAYLQQLKN